jgi:hypothetical protein
MFDNSVAAINARIIAALGVEKGTAYIAEAEEIAADYAVYAAKMKAATTPAEKAHYVKMISAQNYKQDLLNVAYGLATL